MMMMSCVVWSGRVASSLCLSLGVCVCVSVCRVLRRVEALPGVIVGLRWTPLRPQLCCAPVGL